MNIDAKWGLPECMRELVPHTTPLRILSLAEVGNTASADHLLQMATMPLEHKTTALGIPYSCPVSYHFDGADVLQQSLHSRDKALRFWLQCVEHVALGKGHWSLAEIC